VDGKTGLDKPHGKTGLDKPHDKTGLDKPHGKTGLDKPHDYHSANCKDAAQFTMWSVAQ